MRRKQVKTLAIRKPVVLIKKNYEHAGPFEVVKPGSPFQTAQLIGSLVIRFAMFAESGLKWAQFPDRGLLDTILKNCSDPDQAEKDLTALLFHHSKILDNCGKRGEDLRKLTLEAFPKHAQKAIESPQWEIV